MDSLKVLKLKITAPSAHYRVMHSNNPRKTYPVPPYSTVIGLLANIIGEQNKIDKMLSESFSLGIASKYQYLSREYTWMRNMAVNKHEGRFFSTNNRNWQELPEHPGGQSPIVVEVLNDVETYVYLYHSNMTVLEDIQTNIDLPEKWLNHLHLGRAEDWAIVEDCSIVELTVSNKAQDFKDAKSYYQWMPGTPNAYGINDTLNEREYKSLYAKMQGNIVLVTTIYKLVNVPYKDKKKTKHTIIRNFQHVPARLGSSQIPFLDTFNLPSLYTDQQLGIPVYMCLIEPNGKKREC